MFVFKVVGTGGQCEGHVRVQDCVVSELATVSFQMDHATIFFG